MRRQVVGHLIQRLKVEDWYRRHPEIDGERLMPALIGLGLPRTGSTALSGSAGPRSPTCGRCDCSRRIGRAHRRRPSSGTIRA